MSEPLFEVATRDDTRPVVRGRPPVPRWAVLAALPAVLAVLAVLVVPFGFTVAASLDGPSHYPALLTDDRVATAARNSLAWVAFAVVLAGAGFGLAELIRRSGAVRGPAVAVLAAPVAVSALVVGVAFRLIFDADPDRGTVAALVALVGSGPDASAGFLGPDGIALVLGSAFAWSWIGLAVVVLGTGLRTVPYDRLRMARAAGVGPLRRLFTVLLQPIRPVLAVVALTLLVAASRVFDLVLVAVPGSVQQATDVVGLAWLRSADDLPPGERAALVVVLSVVLAGLAAGASSLGATRRWLAGDEPAAPVPVPAEPRGRPARRPAVVAVGLVVAVWTVPFVVLAATSLRDPEAVARSGWWSGRDWSADSYRAAFAGGELTAALAGSATVATVATLVLLLLAVPAAYAFAWGGLRRRRARAAAAGCAVLAVLPVQAYAPPLGELVARAQALGAPTVLALVHAVIGLPFAVLLLRGAFATVPPGEVVGHRLDGGELQAALAVVRARVLSVVAVAVLEFVLVWNDLVVGLLLGAPGTRLVSLALLGGSRQFAVDAGVLSASAVVATAVPLLLVLGTGRWLVRGLAAGVAR